MSGALNAPAATPPPRGRPTGASPVDNAEPSPRQRGPYKGRKARLTYEQRLALRGKSRPTCKCGCGTQTRWLSGKARWAVYASGHYRQDALYKNEAWLREQYLDQRRTLKEIADECGVGRTVVNRFARKFGIELRSRSESRRGRRLGADNHAWKGGVADWDYAPGWKSIAREIRDRDEWTCQDCGEQRKRWGHHLHVHHIDGNKLNNDPGNLISLCAACHKDRHRKGVI